MPRSAHDRTNAVTAPQLEQPGSPPRTDDSDRPALRFLGRALTWRELHDRSTALAQALRQHGIEAGDRVLVVMVNRPEYLEALLAITAAGAIGVPVTIRMSAADAVFVARDAGAKGIVTDGDMAKLAAAIAADSPAIEFVVAVDSSEQGQLSYEELVTDRTGATHSPGAGYIRAISFVRMTRDSCTS
jgi:fatty-acyl-CoA synthase